MVIGPPRPPCLAHAPAAPSRSFTDSQIIYGRVRAGAPLNATGLSIQFIIHRPRAAASPLPPLHPPFIPPNSSTSLYPPHPTTPFLSKLIVSTPAECCGQTHCHTTSGRGKKGRERA
ncbi:hypothetical protein NQZ68_002148 [Dissostichus eleginoides]|nr:hypothetical protein NQZ68_002148 [Dissostichus eleginoides]